MNYLYEHQGLFNPSGQIQLDFSHAALPVLHENALADGASLTTPPYRRAWYAPFYLLDGNGNPTNTIKPARGEPGCCKGDTILREEIRYW